MWRRRRGNQAIDDAHNYDVHALSIAAGHGFARIGSGPRGETAFPAAWLSHWDRPLHRDACERGARGPLGSQRLAWTPRCRPSAVSELTAPACRAA
jgi:hypothetical protein